LSPLSADRVTFLWRGWSGLDEALLARLFSPESANPRRAFFAMKVVLTTHGSTGDIFPLIGLAVALQQAGHSVRFATSRPFQKDIEEAGVPFFPIPPNWEQEDLAFWMGKMQTLKSPVSQLQLLYKAALPYLEDIIDGMHEALDGADCLVSSYLFPMNKAIADLKGIPFATFAFAHNTVPSKHYPPHGLPKLRGLPKPLQQTWNRFAWRLGNVVVDTAINATISRKMKKKGLSPVRDFFSKSADLVLVGVSPALMRPPIKLHPRFQFTGYCRWQAPVIKAAEDALVAFRGGEPVPVITFGSMVYGNPQDYIARLVRHWPKDKKLIVQPGWSGFKIPPEATHIFEVGRMSHDQLFQHASMVIHHGGAGTTASVLYAQKPHIVVPHIGDQFFFADEVKRLGCGVRVKKERWPERLAEAVSRIETNPAYQKNADKHHASLIAEDGPREAIHQLEHFVARHRGEEAAIPVPIELAEF
jgi:vancomycin aglycone glucosyltransferase